MDKPTLLDALKALPEGDVRRTKTGRVRELLPQIEAAQAAGYSNEDIAKALKDQGLDVSKKTLETMLYRIRKESGLHNPQATQKVSIQKANKVTLEAAMQTAQSGQEKIVKPADQAAITPSKLRRASRNDDIDLDSFIDDKEK